MQIFELHFNPKAKDDRFFDSFVYEPTNSFEKNLGSLYMVGDLKNAMPQNSNFLNNLSEVIKKKYYTLSFKNPNKAISEGLKKANDFLSDEIKKDNVGWLGNLNFSVFSLKDFNLGFTATGNLKILLVRGGEINDIGKNLRSTEIEPYPLKIFFNVVSGKLAKGDMLLVFTEELFEFLSEEKILSKISKISEIDEKKLKDIFPPKLWSVGRGRDISGICFIASLTEDKRKKNLYQGFSKKAKEIIFEKSQESFLAGAFQKIKGIKLPNPIKAFKKEAQPSAIPELKEQQKILVKVKVVGDNEKRKKDFIPKIKIPKIKMPSIASIKNYYKKPNTKKKLLLIAALIFILIIGFLFFKNDTQKRQNETKNSISDIEQKMKAGEGLITTDAKQANSILKQAWNEISLLAKDKKSLLYPSADSLRKNIEKDLETVNKLERIDNPETYIDLNPDNIGFLAQNISYSSYELYFSSPVSKDLYAFSEKKNEGEKIKGEYNLDLNDDSSDLVLFLSKQNNIVYLLEKELNGQKISAPESYVFRSFSSYGLNLYFLDEEKNEIIKYAYMNNFKWNEPTAILQPEVKAKSIAVDGFIWILNEKNGIEAYYKGQKQKSFNLDIFPDIKNFSKIKTRSELPYLYILEPINNRLVVIDKDGNTIKQFQSAKFDNLKDFAVSYDGKTIWVLNGTIIYKLSF